MDHDYYRYFNTRLLVGKTNGKPQTQVWAYMTRSDLDIKFRDSKNPYKCPEFASTEWREPFRTLVTHFSPPIHFNWILTSVYLFTKWCFLQKGITHRCILRQKDMPQFKEICGILENVPACNRKRVHATLKSAPPNAIEQPKSTPATSNATVDTPCATIMRIGEPLTSQPIETDATTESPPPPLLPLKETACSSSSKRPRDAEMDETLQEKGRSKDFKILPECRLTSQ